jgi:hypothetical protein
MKADKKGVKGTRCSQHLSVRIWSHTNYSGPFTTRAPEKKRKHEIAFGCVILKKNNLAKDIREKTT